MKCPACGQDSPDGPAVCPECSEPLDASVAQPDADPTASLIIPPPIPDAIGVPDEPAESGPAFVVVLADAGPRKIQAIKVTRDATSLGLAEAKRLVELAPIALPMLFDASSAFALAQEYREAGVRADVMPLDAAEKQFGPISAVGVQVLQRRTGCIVGPLGIVRMLWR